MKKEKNRNFIYKSESLVKPKDVNAISFLGDFNKYLPKKTQQKIMEKGNSNIPYMGFIVDPYCFFLSYKIKDTGKAQAMLPEGYELAEVSVFEDGEKTPMLIVSAFSARTSAFIGVRLEFYIIARNKETGMISWIIADYETNTNSHDPKNGFCGYTSDPSVFTISPYGELLIDFENSKLSRDFNLRVDLKNGKMRALDEALWVEGNLSVDYGGILKDESSRPFSLIFDPVLMKEALQIPVSDVEIVKNSFFDEIIDYAKPYNAVVFPYSQHFIIKQDLKKNELKNEKDLENQVDSFLSRTGFKTMSGDDIKKPLFRSMAISTIVNIGIILLLLILLLK